MLLAGHPVDPVVTADTRRIIRLPGTIHGSTGWICSTIEYDWLEKPVNDWIGNLPSTNWQSTCQRIPPFPAQIITDKETDQTKSRCRFRIRRIPQPGGQYTRPRYKRPFCLDLISPVEVGSPRQAISMAQKHFEELDLGPAAYLEDGRNVLAIIPRALPRDYLISKLTKAGLTEFANDLRRFEHAWVRVSGRMAGGGWESELEPLTVLGYEASTRCKFPGPRPIWIYASVWVCLSESIRRTSPAQKKRRSESPSGAEFMPHVCIQRSSQRRSPTGNDSRCYASTQVPHRPRRRDSAGVITEVFV